MNITRLRAAGLSDETIVRVLEVVHADEAERLAERREQARIRMRKVRTKKPVSNHTSRSHGDANIANIALQGDMWEPLEDMLTKLFREGTLTLMSWGTPEKKCRSLIGMWLKKKDDPEGLLALIKFARDRNVAEPVAYISSMVGGSANGRRSRSLDEVARELEAECLERERAF